MKTIIDNKSKVSDTTALELVSKVIAQGKISKHKGEPCYCWPTTFKTWEGDCVVAYFVNKASQRFFVQDDLTCKSHQK